MPTFRNDYNAGNRSGNYVLDTEFLALPSWAIQNARPHPDGELIDIDLPGPPAAVLRDVVLHEWVNTTFIGRDLTRNLVVITAEQMNTLTDAQQTILYEFANHPAGRHAGATRPPRAAVINAGGGR